MYMRLRALWYAVIFVTASVTSPATATGNPNYFCKIDDEKGEVLCIRMGEVVPVFEYQFQATKPFSTLFALENIKAKRGGGREQYRITLERFRKEDVEKFRESFEKLRETIESMRETQKIDIALYKQLMFMYSDLILRFYGGGIDTYEQGISIYRSETPYPTF
jgi:hypothetical protein